MVPEKTKKGFLGLLPLRIALFLLAGAALVTLIFWQARIAEKREELSNLETQLATQEARNKEAQDAVDALDTEEGLKQYAERKAREELDYARPEERVFVDVGG